MIHQDDRWGPFDSIHEPIALLNLASKDRGHTDAEAYDFFCHQSAIEQMEDGNG